MKGRGLVVAYLCGVGWAHQQPQADTMAWLLFLSLMAVVSFCIGKRIVAYGLGYGFLILTVVLGAYVLTHYQIAQQLLQRLEQAEENKPFRLIVQIDSLVRMTADSRYFEALVLQATPSKVPERIALRWTAKKWSGPYTAPRVAHFPELKPGQIWEVTAFLKTPTGSSNPGAFDYEGHLFAQGVLAIGSIRGEPVWISDTPEFWSVHLVAERWRHHLRQAMMPYVEHSRWGGVLLALSIGDQASINAQDWLVFNRTGLTHLVSISGSHVTFLAALSAWLFSRLWRQMRWRGVFLAERIPAAVVGGVIALLIAGAYSLTAGWEVPARRTFIMFFIAVSFLLMRSSLALTQIVAFAVFIVLVFDPWAWFASGFWLSFGAVLVLVACSQWSGVDLRVKELALWRTRFNNFIRASWWQCFITIALLPPLAFMFFELSLVSPFSNAYAIPLIGLFITPLALLFALLSLLPWSGPASVVFYLAHWLLEVTMWLTVWLSHLPAASIPAARPPKVWLGVALIGVMVALCFRHRVWSLLGWLCVLPALLWQPPLLAPGQWRIHALDVGQGSAIVVETRHRILLFDTGNRYGPDSDEGQRTIVPYLHYLGKKQIDVLVLSHEDLDHIGGSRSVLDRLPVLDAYSSFDIVHYLEKESAKLAQPMLSRLPDAMQYCEKGKKWSYDGVEFMFLWPRELDPTTVKDKNAISCVLQITGQHHKALLTGDIGLKEELQLVSLGLGQQDVVVIGHHGSKTSSSPTFVQAVQARIAIAQQGWWNRFGHPHPEVERRWKQSGAQFFRSDYDGGIVISSRGTELALYAERRHKGRYWQNPLGR